MLGIAVDNQKSERAATTAGTKSIEFRASRGKLFLCVLFFAGLTAFSAIAVHEGWEPIRGGPWIFHLSVAVSAMFTVIGVIAMIFGPQPLYKLSDEGLVLAGISHQAIPWASIKSIGQKFTGLTAPAQSIRYVVLDIDQETFDNLPKSRYYWFSRMLGTRQRAGELLIPVHNVITDSDQIHDALCRFRAAYGGATQTSMDGHRLTQD